MKPTHLLFASSVLSVFASLACSAPTTEEGSDTSSAVVDIPRVYAAAKVSPEQTALTVTLSTTASRTADCRKLVLRAYTARSGDCGSGNERTMILSLPETSFGANETKKPIAVGEAEFKALNEAEPQHDLVFCGADRDFSEQDCGYRCIFENQEYPYGKQIRSTPVNEHGHVTSTCELQGVATEVVCEVVKDIPMGVMSQWLVPGKAGANGDERRSCTSTGAISHDGMSCNAGYSPISNEACAESPCSDGTPSGTELRDPVPGGTRVRICKRGSWTEGLRCDVNHKNVNGACAPKASCGNVAHGGVIRSEILCLPGGEYEQDYVCEDGSERKGSKTKLNRQCR